MLKQKVIDEYLQEWTRDINDNRVLIVYKALQTTFAFELYLETIVSRNLRSAITKIRICADNLRIQTEGMIEWKEIYESANNVTAMKLMMNPTFWLNVPIFFQIKENYIKT